MSYRTFLSQWLSMNRPDVTLAKLGVLVSVLLLGLRLVASQPFLLMIPLAIGTGSGLYVLTQTGREVSVSRVTLPQSAVGYLPSTVFLTLASLVLVVHVSGVRTDLAYLLTGAVGTVIIVQILFVDDDRIATGSVLFQILAAAIVIRYAGLFTTPGYVGVDIWTHTTVFIDGITRSGTLGSLTGTKYITAPFYHVVGAIGAQVFGQVRNGLYLSLGLIIPLSAVFVYAATSLLVPARWALLATALYAFSDQFIRWGMHIIPTSLGLVFFLASVYLVTRLYHDDAEPWVVALLLACSLATVFTHQVSTAIQIVFLGIAAFVAVAEVASGIGLSRSGGIRNALALVGVFTITLVTTLVSWVNTPHSGGSTFFWREVSIFVAVLTQEAGFLNLAGGGGGGTASPVSRSLIGQLAPYIELFGFAVMLSAAVLGGLYMLRGGMPTDLTSTHLLTAAGLFVIVFGLSLFGIRAFLPGRWMAFLYASMAILAAVGLFAVSQTGSRRVVLVLFVVVAVGYPTTMVVAEKATLDNPAFENRHSRFAYTEAEIAAVDRIEESRQFPEEATVGTDHPYRTFHERFGRYDAMTLRVDADGPVGTDTTVYRDYQSSGTVMFHDAEGEPRAVSGDVGAIVCPSTWNKVYANDEVWVCSAPGVGPGGSR